MATLPCDDGAGSLNNPNGSPEQIGTNNPNLKPYIAPTPEIGSWEISALNPDQCALNDQARQETYIEESLNISGAPLNIFKLLGVHEQNSSSLLTGATIIASQSSPGYPVTNINSPGLSWRSMQTGAGAANSFVGVDFGIKKLSSGDSSYKPEKPSLKKIGCVEITQANTPNEFAKQVKVEIADGETAVGDIVFSGTGDGDITSIALGLDASQGLITVIATSATEFDVLFQSISGGSTFLGSLIVDEQFNTTIVKMKIEQGSIPFSSGDMFTFPINYVWKRAGIFNLTQSPLAQKINFQTSIFAKAIRIIPTLFTGTGNWEVSGIDLFESSQTNIDNIQDLFLNENRDRDYSLEPIFIKAQYSPTDGITDLSKFGLSFLDQYSFTVSFAAVVRSLGRPIVVGDIIEVIPEMQYDHNLKPVRKFLEVTDTSWSSEGFTAFWRPTTMRFVAQQALPSQETRDIFGTLDTQKYLVADSVLTNTIGEQLDTTPLTQTEEIIKEAKDRVPEIGSNDDLSITGITVSEPLPPRNKAGQPQAVTGRNKKVITVEDGLPPGGEPYGEGYKLPDTSSAADGDYFRLYYPPETKIPPRLYRFSALKNRWIYQETDRRGDYSSHKPSVRQILQSDSKQSLGKKTT